jgi:hypothetical protein
MPNVRAREDGSFEIVFSSDRPTWGKNQPAYGNQDVYYSHSWWLTDCGASRAISVAPSTRRLPTSAPRFRMTASA